MQLIKIFAASGDVQNILFSFVVFHNKHGGFFDIRGGDLGRKVKH